MKSLRIHRPHDLHDANKQNPKTKTGWKIGKIKSETREHKGNGAWIEFEEDREWNRFSLRCASCLLPKEVVINFWSIF